MQHHDAYMNPKTHQLQQTIYLATANLDSNDPDDLFKIESVVTGEEAAGSGESTGCKIAWPS